jgi:hypothetical protein
LDFDGSPGPRRNLLYRCDGHEFRRHAHPFSWGKQLTEQVQSADLSVP